MDPPAHRLNLQVNPITLGSTPWLSAPIMVQTTFGSNAQSVGYSQHLRVYTQHHAPYYLHGLKHAPISIFHP
jgi:hypothetical protein